MHGHAAPHGAAAATAPAGTTAGANGNSQASSSATGQEGAGGGGNTASGGAGSSGQGSGGGQGSGDGSDPNRGNQGSSGHAASRQSTQQQQGDGSQQQNAQVGQMPMSGAWSAANYGYVWNMPQWVPATSMALFAPAMGYHPMQYAGQTNPASVAPELQVYTPSARLILKQQRQSCGCRRNEFGYWSDECWHSQ